MAAVTLTPTDLQLFAEIDDAKAQAMVDTALARAARVAPCIRDDTLSADHSEAAKGVIRDAILRWNDGGSGALATRTVGAVSEGYDTRQQRRSLFWPSEIEELQAICAEHRGDEASGAYSVDTIPTTGAIVHADICALNFGADYCSCGAVLTGLYPLYEVP